MRGGVGRKGEGGEGRGEEGCPVFLLSRPGNPKCSMSQQRPPGRVPTCFSRKHNASEVSKEKIVWLCLTTSNILLASRT